VPQDTHIPEYAVMAVGAAALPYAARGAALRLQAATAFDLYQDSAAPIRPIRLFAHPEPIEAVAEVPDGPPVQFIWRRIRHIVLHVEGPERIAMEWWRDANGNVLMRDYFRVESHDGLRVWLYRAWPTPEKEEDQRLNLPLRWYVHGTFA
jgi:protein ImuB